MLSYQELKLAREKSSLSQSEVAEKIGVSRQALSKWENGRGYPEMDNLVALSRLYALPLDDVFEIPFSERRVPKNWLFSFSPLLLVIELIIAVLFTLVNLWQGAHYTQIVAMTALFVFESHLVIEYFAGHKR